MYLQSFLQFKSLTLEGRENVKDNNHFDVALTYLMNFLMTGFLDLKRLKENHADLENVFKKRRVKISSMRVDVPISRYPDKSENFEKHDEKNSKDCHLCGNMEEIILTENGVENREVELSEVCNKCFSNIILRFVRLLRSMDLQSFLQFKSLILEGRENVKDNDHLDVS
jgi:hypothetical protein